MSRVGTPEQQPPAPGGRKTLLGRLADWIFNSALWKSMYMNPYPRDRRTRGLAVLNSLFLHLHPGRITRQALTFRYTFGLGGTSFFMFILLTITGIVLMFYYIPAVPEAYFSVEELHTSVAFGQFFRNIHRWAAHAMVLLVFLHMVRVFYTGAYKPPRQFNWVIGVVLLVLTFLMSFTGYLLPWDQLAYWAVTVGTNMAGATPFIGDKLKFLLLGGYDINQNTLIRWYTLHVFALPLVAAVFMGMHFWRVRKDGFSR